jgi:hypothetical protein
MALEVTADVRNIRKPTPVESVAPTEVESGPPFEPRLGFKSDDGVYYTSRCWNPECHEIAPHPIIGGSSGYTYGTSSTEVVSSIEIDCESCDSVSTYIIKDSDGSLLTILQGEEHEY